MLVRICPKCRHPNQPEARFCVACGFSIHDQPPVEHNLASQASVEMNIGQVAPDGIAIGNLVAAPGSEVNIGQAERQLGAEGGGLPPSNAGRYVARGTIEDDLWQALQARRKRAVVGVGGMGGVGKTEMALHLARRANEENPGGVLWVSIGDRLLRQVHSDMARALGIKLDPNADDQGNAADIRRRLEQKPRLVILDDVRKEFVPWLGFCLPPCPPCALLLTSRLQEIPGLEHGEMRQLDVMDEAQALELLSADPQIATQLHLEAGAARELVRKCSYHPLALDLALPQLRRRLEDSDTPLADYVQGLTSRLSQLKGLSNIRRSLLASFDLSYDALSDVERRRFRYLAAFAESGFRPIAAATLWQVGEAEALETLDGLWNVSLLQRGRRKGWWKLHDLLHEYAAYQLAQCSEETAARRAQASWMIGLFERHYADDPSTTPELAFEIENLTTAVKWAMIEKNGELLAQLATTPRNWLYNYFRLWDEWQNWLHNALEFGIKDDRLKANVLKAIGDVQQFRKDMEAALASYGEALGLFRLVGSKLGEANVLMSLGDMAIGQEDWSGAISAYEQALPLYRAIEARLGMANTLIDLGRAYFKSGQREKGIACEQEAVFLYTTVGLESWAKRARANLAEMQH